MRLFDFLMVLVSIIIGLGVAEILTGLGQFLRARGTAKSYAVHSLVVALIFLSQLQHWWGSWELRGMSELHFPGLMLFVAGPVILFLLGYLAFPQTVADCDLEEYYYTYGRQLWGLGALYVVTTIVFRPIVAHAEWLTPQNLLRGAAVVLCVVLASSQRKAVHALGVGGVATFLALYVLAFMFWLSQ